MITRIKPDIAASWDALAGGLGIPRRRLFELRHHEGCPKNKNVSEWQVYLKSLLSVDDEDPEYKALERQKLSEEVRKLKINNDLKQDVVVGEALQSAQEVLTAMAKRLRSVLIGLVPARIAKSGANKFGHELESIVRQEIEKGLQEAKAQALASSPSLFP